MKIDPYALLRLNEALASHVRCQGIVVYNALFPPKLFTRVEAADILGISIAGLDRLVAQGKLPAYRPTGRKIYFTEESLKNFIEANTQCTEKIDPAPSANIGCQNVQTPKRGVKLGSTQKHGKRDAKASALKILS